MLQLIADKFASALVQADIEIGETSYRKYDPGI